MELCSWLLTFLNSQIILNKKIFYCNKDDLSGNVGCKESCNGYLNSTEKVLLSQKILPHFHILSMIMSGIIKTIRVLFAQNCSEVSSD